MQRPYIFCHMRPSLMGKIWGAYIQDPYCDASAQVYFDVGFGPDCVRPYQAWLLGSNTAEVGWTNYKKPARCPRRPLRPDFLQDYYSTAPYSL